MLRYAIYSCEGFAREVLPSLRTMIGASSGSVEPGQIVWVDDDSAKHGINIEGIEVISFSSLLEQDNRERLVNVCIADPGIRERLVGRCVAAGLDFFSITDASHIRFDNCRVGEGAVFAANTMATGHAKIGRHFHCNIYSYVAHDCEIGDFVTFAPRVSCNGRVHIGDRAYIGTGAVLKQGEQGNPLRIGSDAVVGMGAVVLNDVPDGAVVVGNPAKIIKIRGERV